MNRTHTHIISAVHTKPTHGKTTGGEKLLCMIQYNALISVGLNGTWHYVTYIQWMVKNLGEK